MSRSPDEIERELDELRAKFLDTQAVVPAAWNLTAKEERVFRVLLAVETATRAAVAEGAGLKPTRTVDVHLCRIRPKIEPFGVEIETVRNRGWRLVNREAWRRSLGRKAA